MEILIGCEFSGVVRDAFRKKGHNAYSCDILPADGDSTYHLQMDVFEAIKLKPWDLAIFHPPCTYLCSSGLHWNTRVPGRQALTEEAVQFVKDLLNCGIPRIALENPIGCISSRIRKPDQIIHPYMFGDDASKSTCLWLKNLPPLRIPPESDWFPARIVNGKKRYGNQTDSGQNKLGPSADRWAQRSITYQGIADAMAEQWTLIHGSKNC